MWCCDVHGDLIGKHYAWKLQCLKWKIKNILIIGASSDIGQGYKI